MLCGGGRLLAAGNGGSAAQAQHLTAELVGRYRADRPPFSAIALHAETSSLTAIANDYGVEEVFARQVEAHGRPGDVLRRCCRPAAAAPTCWPPRARARECGLTVLGADRPGAQPAGRGRRRGRLHRLAVRPRPSRRCTWSRCHLLCAAFDAAALAEPARVPAPTRSGSR